MKKFIKTFLLFSAFIIFTPSSYAFTLIGSTITAGWDTTELTFDVNDSSCTTLGISSTVLYAAVDAAIDLWNKTPTTSIKLKRGASVSSTTSTNPPTIYCSNVGQTAGTAGVGTISQITAGHPSLGSLALNGDNTKAAYFGTLGTTDQDIVVAHEIGHVLGLGHSEKQYALMYYDISSKTNLNLSQDDADGLSWLNPRNELSSGPMGCGTIEDVGGNFPPANAGVIFNWALLLLITFASSRFVKLTNKA